MKTWIKNIIYILPALVLFNACTPEIEVPAPVAGAADFSKYIAVGNSLTAGYADNGLYEEGQLQSYPNVIAQQMNEVIQSDFRQPDIPGNGSGYVYVTSLAPSFGLFEPDPNWLDQLEGPFNNLGVPGIRVKDITFKGYGSSPQVNPYFFRMLGGKDANMSYLEMVAENPPSFFTSWIGNNDVLGYASSGGVAGIAGAPGTGLGGLTDPSSEFKPSYDALIGALTSQRGKGVVVTIPDITLAPFFTTVSWNDLVLDAQLAELATQFYAFGIDTTVQRMVEVQVFLGAATKQVYDVAYQQAIDDGATEEEATAAAEAYVASPAGQAAIETANEIISASYYDLPPDQRPNHPLYPIIESTKNGIIGLLNQLGLIPTFEEGPNGFVIEVPVTPTNPLGIRQMVEGEFVLLTALLDGQLDGLKAVEPKATQYILTIDEVKNIDDYTDEYNDIIRGYASSSPDIAVFDSNSLLEEIKEGVYIDGVGVNGDFLTGGAFSLDGIHLTPRGYSIAANGIIETINEHFNATLSPVIINNYRAVVLP
jgi:hypothetical protein